MDLNYLYQRHQISLFKSEHAACADARQAHRGLATAYAEQIRRVRSARNATERQQSLRREISASL